MNYLDASKGPFRPAAAAFALAAFSAWGASTALASDPPEPERIAFGQIGIAAGQSVQLNVVHPGLNAPPEPESPVAVHLTILDSHGNTLASSVERLLPGGSVSLTLNRDTLPARTGNRMSLRGLVSFQAPPEPERQGRTRLVSTLEVIDNVTGRTSFVLQAPPEPDKAQR